MRKYVSKKENAINQILDMIRIGKSLYMACLEVNLSTKEFYDVLAKNEIFKEKYLLALSDYADKCTDDIRQIVEELKKGEIDNSTAKLLIETMKWLISKSNSDLGEINLNDDNASDVKEIMVKFI